ncbi:acyl-CoA dehydrogenase family protein [Streptomyces nodosus]
MTDAADWVDELIGGQAGTWDLNGELPVDLVRTLGVRGLLSAQVPAELGGPGWTSLENGEFTAHVGSRCSSLRSLMTSQGMAAWAVQRFGDTGQKAEHLTALTSGSVAGVAFSESGAGSDLSAMQTRIEADGDDIVVTGSKVWVTGAGYADRLVVFGLYGDGAAAVVVPTDAPGVTVQRVADPLGCRAAGHSDVTLDAVRLPRRHLLGGAGLPLDWLVTPVLTYGRISVAWGCVGMLRCCLTETTGHAARREQFGSLLAEHQLVAGHLADLLTAENAATRCCEQASRCWDEGSSELPTAAVVAKQVAAESAARGAATAVQVLGSAGSRDGTPVARVYRDAKLMEIIEGSSEICRLLLARHAVAVWA